MQAKYIISIFIAFSAFVLNGCTHHAAQPEHVSDPVKHIKVQNVLYNHVRQANAAYDKDRMAILAMQGEYEVDFNFKETVILASDYEYFPPKTADAMETVVVVENSPDHIVLQHFLIVGRDSVIKHWRQDWHFEADTRFEFTSDQTWEIKTIDEERRKGFWTQCVYEVSDAPRYCGTGKWNHRYNVSTWTSDRTWRPLPRREYTVRDDYNALNVENRHTVTPSGWTHEQDNTKVRRKGDTTEATLVREFGFNNYRNITGYNFSPAYDYWEKTSPYWASVRAAWLEYFNAEQHVIINTGVDGMPIIGATFAQAQAIESGEAMPDSKSVSALLDQWVNVSSDQNPSLQKISGGY